MGRLDQSRDRENHRYDGAGSEELFANGLRQTRNLEPTGLALYVASHGGADWAAQRNSAVESSPSPNGLESVAFAARKRSGKSLPKGALPRRCFGGCPAQRHAVFGTDLKQLYGIQSLGPEGDRSGRFDTAADAPGARQLHKSDANCCIRRPLALRRCGPELLG